MPTGQEDKLPYPGAKDPPPGATMERDEWEARAFVQEKGALTEPGQQPGNLGNWKGRNVGLASDKLACFCVVLFLRFHYFPPHPLLPLPKKSDSFRGKDTHTHTHTLTPSHPGTHLFSPKQVLPIHGVRLNSQTHGPGGQEEGPPVSPRLNLPEPVSTGGSP